MMLSPLNRTRHADFTYQFVDAPPAHRIYDSGESHTDQGISRQGNRRVRALLIEMAWCWLRYQPSSALTQWFNQRTQGTGPNRRARRIAIVAVARRLAIALWRYLKDGVVPDGAQLKPA
jgi:transposase